jgi:aminopeptidase N
MSGAVPALAALAAAACKAGEALREAAAPASAFAADWHSHAEPERVRVTHVSLDLALEFDARRIAGSVELELVRADPAAPLRLDAQGLEILGVRGSDGGERAFELGPVEPVRGSPLVVELAPLDRQVRIDYRTTDKADALQWLSPEQTAGGSRPFLYTQGQAIYTRTWIPLQDSPQVRVTYDARIRAPERLTVVMAAEHKGRRSDGSFAFRMPQAIPPYLIALACGDLAFRPISPRCGVWAEPGVVERAREELSDTEAMIRAAESLFGPYRWGRYDILVLPPSFPFGGMENPRLTFATPTILAGDKSLVALVAHELAHSWSGNLVTNATWRDFWLNEGTTVYCEQRIMEEVFGAERSNTEKVLERAELEREMASLAPRDQILHVDLEGRHPDEGFSGVPYQKGALLLRRLEQLIGRADFDRFLAGYFDEHAFQGMTTPRFEAYVRERLLAGRPEAASIDLGRWLYEPGLPEDAPRYRSASLEAVDAELARWRGGAEPALLRTSGWTTHQWLHFLEGIEASEGANLDAAAMEAIDRAFDFTRSGNCEVLAAWLRLSIARGYGAADARLESFLMEVGRRKFLKPIYAELARSPSGLERARAIYARARPRYHAVSTGTLDKILGWS